MISGETTPFKYAITFGLILDIVRFPRNVRKSGIFKVTLRPPEGKIMAITAFYRCFFHVAGV